MPKLFPIRIEVEQTSVGDVLRLLSRTPGVVGTNIDLDHKPAKHNGAGEPRGPYKPRKTFDEPGSDAMLAILYGKPPMVTAQLKDAFASKGRSPASIASLLHNAKLSGDVQLTADGYTLTKKSRDRLRHRKASKKK